MNDMWEFGVSLPVSFVVEGCKAPQPKWRGAAALAVMAVNPGLTVYPYTTDEWTREIENTLPRVADAVKYGGQVAVFAEPTIAQPYEPIVVALRAAMRKADIDPQGEIEWIAPARLAEPSDVSQTWRSPHDSPMSSTNTAIVMGSVGFRARDPGPRDQARLRLPHRYDISDVERRPGTQQIWPAEMHGPWTEAGLPHEAVQRLVQLHTRRPDTVLVLGASTSAGIATLQAGRRCLIAAGDDTQALRVAQAIVGFDPELAYAGMTDGRMLTPCWGNGCHKTVWVESEPGDPSLEELLNQHYYIVQGPDDDDEIVFLCDKCGLKLMYHGGEMPD